MTINMEGVASLVMALAAFLTAVGGIRRQDRRPDDNDQTRAAKELRKAVKRANSHRVAYDADAREVLRLHAIVTSADVPLAQPDPLAEVDPERAAHDQQVLATMAGYVQRMESAAATFNEAVDRGGAQYGRAVARITGQQPAVPEAPPQRSSRLPRPDPASPEWTPRSRRSDPP